MLFLAVCGSGPVLTLLAFYCTSSIETFFMLTSLIVIAMVTVLVTVSGKWNDAFCCPDCGGPVDAALDTEGKESAPILRLCPACDVLWETGVTPSN